MDRIVVANKSVAKVYVKRSKPSPVETTDSGQGQASADPNRKDAGLYKYYFNIGSVESFEEKLEAAQGALGINPHDYVPVTYVNEGNWLQELMKFAPTVLLLAALWFGNRRIQQLGMRIGGPGGKGVRGIFDVGKAQITKMDQNAKDKVSDACVHILSFLYYSLYPDQVGL